MIREFLKNFSLSREFSSGRLDREATNTTNHQFCGVFLYADRLYVAREQGAGGPRCMVWPPKEVPTDISASMLSQETFDALTDYCELGRPIYADEWEERNRQLLDYFSAPDVATFERRKKGVTVRRDLDSQAICLFSGDGQEIDRLDPADDDLGSRIKQALDLLD